MRHSSVVLIWILAAMSAVPLRADPLNTRMIPVSSEGLAERELAADVSHHVTIRGRDHAVLVGPEVRLADIAEVRGRAVQDDEAVIALQKTVLAQSPAPGEAITLSAQEILERLRAKGVDLERVGYLLPRVVQIERASRTISMQEVRAAIEQVLLSSGRKAEIREVGFKGTVRVGTGDVSLEAVPLTITKPGHQDFTVKVQENGATVQQFSAQASVDEWAELPVAGRPLPKGSVIRDEDLVMARLNLSSLPKDATADRFSLVGLKVNQDVSPGQIFRRPQLAVPPLVEAGGRVTLRYRSGSLEATATGIAIDGGALGEMVRVKNESSKRIVNGIVADTGLVEVRS